MHTALLLLAALQGTPQPAAAAAREAVAAVEGDSVASLRRRWTRRVERDANDRPARLGLAALAQLTYDDSTAERQFRALLPGPGQPADLAAGYAAQMLARLLLLRGHWLRADSSARLAVEHGRATGDSALLGEALVTLAVTQHRVKGAAAALPLLDSAEAILPANEHRTRALAHCARAQVYSFAGDPRATVEVRAGIERATQAGEARVRASCRNVLAGELARRAQFDSALVEYYSLIADYRRARDRGGLAVALQWRSHIYRQVGWLARSRRDAEESIGEAEASRVRAPIPWARATLAYAALALGDLGSAAPQAAEAARLFREQGDRYARANVRGLEGYVAAMGGDWAAARVAYGDALSEAEALGWAESEVSLHRALMQIEMREGDYVAAARELAAANQRARRANMKGFLGSNRYFEAVLALQSGRLAAAEQMLHTQSDLLGQPQWTYLRRARLAEVLARQGRPAEAEQALRAANTAFDRWRGDLRDRDLRLFALQLAEDVFDPDLGIATVVNVMAKAGMIPQAFELVEATRARELADRLTRAAALDTGTDRAVRADAAATLQTVMNALPDDSTALLRFVTGRGGEPTTVFVATFSDYTTLTLAAEDSLAPVIARFSAMLESGDDASALGRQLGAVLIEPLLNLWPASTRRLVIVPDGPLHRLPFDALILADGRHVVERFAVSYAPSATAAVALWGRRGPTPAVALVMADPRFAGETAPAAAGADAFRGAVAGRGALPRLRGSAREARAVARYAATATVRRRGDASEAWLKRAPLDAYGVVHFATHALVDQGSMINTALALAPGDGEDGFLNAGELLGLRLQADLVVLSACRTAGGVLVQGEGIQGLANPLLVVGARAVAATWWPISDQASIAFVDDFYRALASGRAAGDALREAKIAALRRGAPEREWAAFSIIGDATVRPQLRLPTSTLSAAALAAIALAVVAVGAVVHGVVRRKRRTADAG